MKIFDNHFLFSETYINEYINEKKKKGIINDSLYKNFQSLKGWLKDFLNEDDLSDDEWIDEFVDPVLESLGFKTRKNGNIRILHTNTISENEKPIATCFLLEKNDDVDTKIKGNYYGYKAIKAARDNEVEWAMLTNGLRWRIYNTKNISPYENYLEVDIESSLSNGEPDDAFKLFNLFFNVYTYFRAENGELEIENIKDMSDKRAETIEDFLRGKAEEILTDLCYGFKENMKLEFYTDEDKRNIYNDAIILLYRLLFLGYAESRGLLPLDLEDTKYLDNSFFKICEDAKELLNSGRASEKRDGYNFWDRIDEYLRIYVAESYDGGLFENEDKPILGSYKIANGYLMKCLVEMTYYKDKKTNVYTDKIEYKDLSVRNLGAIYEGLLEYNLFIAEERMVPRKSGGNVKYLKASETNIKRSEEDSVIEVGGIYLSQDAVERKETGSYYTPEDVVEYIVSNTVGKKIEELRNELNNLIRDDKRLADIEPNKSIKLGILKAIDDRVLTFIKEKILSLSIIDSAMGSGHFLVNAAYKVANSIVDILCDNDWENEEIPVDIVYWKRRVVERCIYGIDINKLAVYLARLSIWLISASNDKPLSFIDHHLKEGNSVVGTDRKKVEMRGNHGKNISIFDVNYEDIMVKVLNKYEKLRKLGSDTNEEIQSQKELYKEIENDLKLVKLKYNYYLSSQYAGGIKNKDKYALLMRTNSVKSFEKDDIKELTIFANKIKFFHWELEFPNIIFNGGFDIAIGNPPYVEASSNNYIGISETNECHNLYAYVIEILMKNIKKCGRIGLILPSASVSTPRMDSLQKLLMNNSKTIYISTYDDRPSKLFLRLEHMRAAIVILNRENNSKSKQVFTTKYNRWYSNERKNLFKILRYHELDKVNYMAGYITKVGNHCENNILEKLFSQELTISNYVSSKDAGNNVYYGYGVQYWIKALDRSASQIDNIDRKSTGEKALKLYLDYNNKVFTSLLNSSIFYWYFLSFSDCRNLTKNTILSFPFDYNRLNENIKNKLIRLCDLLMNDYVDNSRLKNCNYSSTGMIVYREYFPKKSKKIIDEIDKTLSEHYKFNTEELYYIINYDIRFRMGDKGEE